MIQQGESEILNDTFGTVCFVMSDLLARGILNILALNTLNDEYWFCLLYTSPSDVISPKHHKMATAVPGCPNWTSLSQPASLGTFPTAHWCPPGLSHWPVTIYHLYKRHPSPL